MWKPAALDAAWITVQSQAAVSRDTLVWILKMQMPNEYALPLTYVRPELERNAEYHAPGQAGWVPREVYEPVYPMTRQAYSGVAGCWHDMPKYTMRGRAREKVSGESPAG